MRDKTAHSDGVADRWAVSHIHLGPRGCTCQESGELALGLERPWHRRHQREDAGDLVVSILVPRKNRRINAFDPCFEVDEGVVEVDIEPFLRYEANANGSVSSPLRFPPGSPRAPAGRVTSDGRTGHATHRTGHPRTDPPVAAGRWHPRQAPAETSSRRR
jgi:hypothetical protein